MAKSPFKVATPEESPGFLLWQTTLTWQRQIKKTLDLYNLPHAQFVILAILLWFEKTKQKPTQVVIANWSKLDKMTVSKSLKMLATQGLVKRTENKIDTRAKTVNLTSAGRELATKLVPIVEAIDTEFFSGVSSHEIKTLTKILHNVVLNSNNRG